MAMNGCGQDELNSLQSHKNYLNSIELLITSSPPKREIINSEKQNFHLTL